MDQLWMKTLLVTTVAACTVAHRFSDSPMQATVQVNLDTPLYTTDDRFLSLGMDSNLIRDRWETFDFNSARLQTLAAGLAPAYMRLMGTDGDRMMFVRDDVPLKSANRIGGWPFPQNSFNMTSSDWDSINRWTAAVGWRLLFGINAQTRLPPTHGNWTVWDASNALELLDYSVQKGYAANLDFEFGNEPNIWLARRDFAPVSPERLATEFQTFQNVLTNFYGSHFSGSILVGPDVTKSGVAYMKQFLDACGDIIHATTFHQYYGKGTDFVDVRNYLDPLVLDAYGDLVTDVVTTVRQSKRHNVAIWQGETSSTVSPPGNGIDETYVAGFMLLDKLGLSARLGLSLVVRQTFYGFWFALVDEKFEPRPNYWLALMFKRLVGREVLDAQVNVTDNPNNSARLRLYAHCTSAERSGYAPGSVVLYAMNLFNSTVHVQFNNTLSSGNVHQYVWTPPNGNLTSEMILLNGQPVKMISDTELPIFKPVISKASQGVTIPPYALVYYVFADVKVKHCTTVNRA